MNSIQCPKCKKHTPTIYSECLGCGSPLPKLKQLNPSNDSVLKKESSNITQHKSSKNFSATIIRKILINFSKAAGYVISFFVILGFIVHFGAKINSSSSSTKTVMHADVDACVNRGIAYFKEIGSYPTLISEPNIGRSAETVARERCNRGVTAF